MSNIPAPDLSGIVKACKVRGVVPDQLDEDRARSFGVAFAETTGAASIVIGHDMLPSPPGPTHPSPGGGTSHGTDAVETGLCSTDQRYFARSGTRRAAPRQSVKPSRDAGAPLSTSSTALP
ncbi:hypothetical protein ACFTTN_03630 [Streptomyces niveus]|uniref:hypothetical protein n=1 Tax=Streptomyces niveus TaxID=193462 RepID=UPI0036435229